MLIFIILTFILRIIKVRIININVRVLKSGKAAGANGISNEFLIYDTSEILVEALHILYDLMFMNGAVPTDLNTALLIPIPKSKDIAAPSDYRPISVSTPICTLLELLLRQRMPFLEQKQPNQFGYKKATSCKTAYCCERVH